MAVVRVPRFEIAAGHQPAGAHSEFNVEGMMDEAGGAG
jgi:hypothetical protein